MSGCNRASRAELREPLPILDRIARQTVWQSVPFFINFFTALQTLKITSGLPAVGLQCAHASCSDSGSIQARVVQALGSVGALKAICSSCHHDDRRLAVVPACNGECHDCNLRQLLTHFRLTRKKKAAFAVLPKSYLAMVNTTSRQRERGCGQVFS